MSDDTESREIQPALTPDEWRVLTLRNAGKPVGGKVRGQVVRDLPPDHQHGAAACALYGQPFGFTQEDVQALETAVFAIERAGSQFDCSAADCDITMAERDAAARVVAKIRALLPPAI
jgi:hypothetical protein